MSQRWIALLRGINVGGHRVKGPELAAVFSDLGYEQVSTFLASGNVIFDVSPAAPAADEDAIAAALEERFGYGVPTLLRTEAEVIAVAEGNPFRDGAGEGVVEGTGKPQVIFVSAPMSTKTKKSVAAMATDSDQLIVDERHIYWLPDNGISMSPLNLDALARLVGTITVRTVNTIERMAKKYCQS